MKPGSKKSEVWGHFIKTEDNKNVICNHCKSYFKFCKNTSNMREHMKRKHPLINISSITNLEPDQPSTSTGKSQTVFCQSSDHMGTSFLNQGSLLECDSSILGQTYDVPSETVEGEIQFKISDVTTIRSPPESPSRKRPRRSNLFENVLTEEEIQSINTSLVEMITHDFQPLSIVENNGFLNYTNKLQPLYKVPSKKFLSTQLLPDLYSHVYASIKELVTRSTAISITTDIWTSNTNVPYITVTAHFINQDVLYASVLSTVELDKPHAGENVAQKLKQIFEDWSITNKITAIVSDNGANIKNAISIHLNKTNIPCIAHTLNLIVTDAIKVRRELNELFHKCRVLVQYFKRNVAATEKLAQLQQQMNLPNLKVKLDVPNRWNSVLIMLKRLSDVKEPLSATLLSLPRAPENLNSNDWSIIKDIVPILKPFEDVTFYLSTERYPTLSCVIPLISGLKIMVNKINPINRTCVYLKELLLESIENRLGYIEVDEMFGKSTFLDPRFKKAAFSAEANGEYIKKQVINELETNFAETEDTKVYGTFPDDTEESIWSHFDKEVAKKKINTNYSNSINMVNQYLDFPIVDRKKNPLEFWAKYSNLFNDLYNLHNKYSCIPATSVPCETVFTKAGLIANDRRNHLPPKYINYIIFLNGNLSILNNY